MKNTDVEKSMCFIIQDLIDYVPHAVVIKSIMKKSTGSVTAMSFDSGEYLPEKISPFDTLIQILEGDAQILINDDLMTLKSGEFVIVPAHSKSTIKANKQFKMISTIIKSGYE